jgi:hypothetical protein
MHRPTVFTVRLIVVLLVAATAHAVASGLPILVEHSRLCVTEGELDSGTDAVLTVTGPKMRAYVNLPIGDAVRTRFSYLGPSSPELPLASGEIRRQFGLKLRAADACNLVYVMWRIKAESKLAVSVKRNPGQETSSECTNHGYVNIKPQFQIAPPALLPGQTHVLGVEIHGEQLQAMIDGKLAWQGDLGANAAAMSGPVGVRSDNSRVAFSLEVGPGSALTRGQLPVCRRGPESVE